MSTRSQHVCGVHAGARTCCGRRLPTRRDRAMTRSWPEPLGSRESDAAAQARIPRGLGARSRVHGDVRVLRLGRRGRGDRDDPARARARHRLHRHRTAVRAADERGAGRPRDQGPARRVRDRDEVRPKGGLGEARRYVDRRSARRLGGARARLDRRLTQAARHRPRRPLLPAPRRPERPDRGDGRGDGRARRARQGAPHRTQRSRTGHGPPSTLRPPDHGAANGVLVMDARP